MLRKVLLALGAIALLAAAVCAGQRQFGPALWLGLNGLALTAGVIFERWRYREPATQAEPRFEPTGERFVDPESGALIEVRCDAGSGERRYVRLPPGAPKPD